VSATCGTTNWVVPADYRYDVPTSVAHRHPNYVARSDRETSALGRHDVHAHGEVYGDFAHLRKELDFSYHTNYTRERQAWQDGVIRSAVANSSPQEQPWAVFTCGAMGAGKGHVMNWLSQHRDFPLEDMVCIDPDRFKGQMPEWSGYVRENVEEAGSLCHKESGIIQELAQEVALRKNCHVWIDGSLADHNWYASVFRELRRRFPTYRIAILHVHCNPETVYQRAQKRGKETGRFVPKALLRESIERTREAIRVLGPLADFVAHVDNQADPPWLDIQRDAPKQASKPCELHEALYSNLPCASSWLPCPLRGTCHVEQGPLMDFVATINQQLETDWIKVRCSQSTFSHFEKLAGG